MYQGIINGKIVTEHGEEFGTVLINGSKIEAILAPDADLSQYPVEHIIDAQGKWIVPGGVDGHVHFGGFGDIPIADDFYTGSRAALAGGTTTVVDFCLPAPGETLQDCIKRRKTDGKASMVDFAFHFAFTKNYNQELQQIQDILDSGIGAFKVYTYYPNTNLTMGEIREIMAQIADKGPLLVHAEEESIIDMEKSKVPDSDKGDFLHVSLTRPNAAERIAVEGMVAVAKETGAKICIAHSSAKETADIRKRERTSENAVILETCPHYLHLNNEKLKDENGGLYCINPPLRTAEDSARLWQAVMEEDIAILSTDHCPYLTKYKANKDYLTVPCGVDGMQTRVQFLFSEGVMKRGLPMAQFVRQTSTNAAKFYNLYPQKGTIAPGSDADLVIIDPMVKWTWGADAIMGATDYTALEGLKLQGKVVATLKGGQLAYNGKDILSEKGSGQFVPNVW